MVYKSILECFICREPAVAVTVSHNLVHGLTRCLGGDLRETLLHVIDQVSLSLDVTGCSTEPTVRLVQQHSSVWGDVALTLRSRSQQQLPHRGSHSDSHGHDVVGDELHRVINRHTGGDGTTG